LGWLKAGVMKENTWQANESGTPQGGIVSPLLANLYLNDVLDQWFESEVKPCLEASARLIRYADDAVLCFKSERDARRVYKVISKRFAKYGLRDAARNNSPILLVFLSADFVPAQSQITPDMLPRRASPADKNPAHYLAHYFWPSPSRCTRRRQSWFITKNTVAALVEKRPDLSSSAFIFTKGRA
jgi:Reverse transcriptase (RNA-dependent DNA polymerase)